jgi:hypothetical protein
MSMGSDGRWHTTNHATIWRWREHFQNDFSVVWTGALNPMMRQIILRCPNSGTTLPSCKSRGAGKLKCSGQFRSRCRQSFIQVVFVRRTGTFAMSTARTGSPLKINDSDKQEAWFIAPQKARMGTMHIILAVSDKGRPSLTRYKRVIVECTN